MGLTSCLTTNPNPISDLSLRREELTSIRVGLASDNYPKPHTLLADAHENSPRPLPKSRSYLA